MSVAAILSGSGEYSPSHKLTDDQVRAIRAERDAGATYRAIGRRYGVTPSNVHMICARITWAHVTDEPPRRTTVARRGINLGEANGQARLTEAQVWQIRQEREAGETYEAIAARHGVTYSTAWNAANFQTWRHVLTPPPEPLPALPPGKYMHAQPIAAIVWTVVHHLGFRPRKNVVVDLTRHLVIADIEHLDTTALAVRFSTAMAGWIVCS